MNETVRRACCDLVPTSGELAMQQSYIASYKDGSSNLVNRLVFQLRDSWLSTDWDGGVELIKSRTLLDELGAAKSHTIIVR